MDSDDNGIAAENDLDAAKDKTEEPCVELSNVRGTLTANDLSKRPQTGEESITRDLPYTVCKDAHYQYEHGDPYATQPPPYNHRAAMVSPMEEIFQPARSQRYPNAAIYTADPWQPQGHEGLLIEIGPPFIQIDDTTQSDSQEFNRFKGKQPVARNYAPNEDTPRAPSAFSDELSSTTPTIEDKATDGGECDHWGVLPRPTSTVIDRTPPGLGPAVHDRQTSFDALLLGPTPHLEQPTDGNDNESPVTEIWSPQSDSIASKADSPHLYHDYAISGTQSDDASSSGSSDEGAGDASSSGSSEGEMDDGSSSGSSDDGASNEAAAGSSDEEDQGDLLDLSSNSSEVQDQQDLGEDEPDSSQTLTVQTAAASSDDSSQQASGEHETESGNTTELNKKAAAKVRREARQLLKRKWVERDILRVNLISTSSIENVRRLETATAAYLDQRTVLAGLMPTGTLNELDKEWFPVFPPIDLMRPAVTPDGAQQMRQDVKRGK